MGGGLCASFKEIVGRVGERQNTGADRAAKLHVARDKEQDSGERRFHIS